MLSRLHKTMYIRIRKDIPILSEIIKKGQRIAIYFEQSHHEGINNFIRINYERIYRQLDSNGITFIYFPAFMEHLDEYVQYFFPDSNGIEPNSLSAEEFYEVIAENIVKMPPTGRPMLIVTDFNKEAQHPPEVVEDDRETFCCFDLEYINDSQFYYDLGQYISRLENRPTIRFHKSDDSQYVCEEEPLYGYDADKESNDILFHEIADRVAKLSARGINKTLLMQFLFLKESLPSKLVITDDFRLLLPDYGNREIKIPKLSKALYFLYLRHKEGLLFKELRDHKDELYDLYRTVSPREDMAAMDRSVEDLVDSTKNSINVNCSRIKNAFVSQIDDSIAKLYYIDGRAREPKFIALDRSLVEDLSGLIMRDVR